MPVLGPDKREGDVNSPSSHEMSLNTGKYPVENEPYRQRDFTVVDRKSECHSGFNILIKFLKLPNCYIILGCFV